MKNKICISYLHSLVQLITNTLLKVNFFYKSGSTFSQINLGKCMEAGIPKVEL